MIIQNGQFLSIEQIQNQYPESVAGVSKASSNSESFDSILKKVQDSDEQVKFSRHAANRLNDRSIEMSESQMERLNSAAAQASEKGINESLILVDQLAFIVNVPNKTVITAMNQNDNNNQVFTNIDGAVIA